jgi:hypothetical protein
VASTVGEVQDRSPDTDCEIIDKLLSPVAAASLKAPCHGPFDDRVDVARTQENRFARTQRLRRPVSENPEPLHSGYMPVARLRSSIRTGRAPGSTSAPPTLPGIGLTGAGRGSRARLPGSSGGPAG